jgi:hypothetical protein
MCTSRFGRFPETRHFRKQLTLRTAPFFPGLLLLRFPLAMKNTSSQHRLSSISPESKTVSSDQSPEPDIHDLRLEGAVLHHVLNSRSKKWG